MEDVHRILREEVDSARKRFDEATRRFQDAINDAGTLHVTLPHSDGVQYIRNVAREQRAAGEELLKALRREVEFVARRVTPDTKE